jgi:hypothetical protein
MGWGMRNKDRACKPHTWTSFMVGAEGGGGGGQGAGGLGG